MTIDAQDLANYAWLADTSLPRIVCEAVQLCRAMTDPAATLDTVLPKGEFERLLRTGQPATVDPAPWSAKLMSVLAARSRKTLPIAPQCALNWSKFGTEAGQPQLGDVLCYLLEDGAYVSLYIGEDEAAYHCLGAGEDGRIAIVRVAKNSLYSTRSPVYQDNMLAVRAVALNRDGSLRR